MQLEDVVRIADEASEVQFNRALLQGAIENINQGISVVDQNRTWWPGTAVTWSCSTTRRADQCRPADCRHHPLQRRARVVRPGEAQVHGAPPALDAPGRAHSSERLFPNGRVIELIGNPMPGAGSS